MFIDTDVYLIWRNKMWILSKGTSTGVSMDTITAIYVKLI